MELERSRQGQFVAGGALIHGWAFGPEGNPVAEGEPFINGELFDTILSGSRRGDAANAFSQQSNALFGGFGISTHYEIFSPGPHTITVWIINQNGGEISFTRQIMLLNLGGFEFAHIDLSGATISQPGGEIVITGALVTSLPDDSQRTVTIFRAWETGAHGSVVTDIR